MKSFYKSLITGKWELITDEDELILPVLGKCRLVSDKTRNYIWIFEGDTRIEGGKITDVAKNANGDKYASLSEFISATSDFFADAPALTGADLTTSLTETVPGKALDSTQGKILDDKIKQLTSIAPSIGRFKLLIPDDNTTISNYCDDSSLFSEYIGSEWDDSFEDYLKSLGSFDVDWGDGNFDTFNYLTDGLQGGGFAHTYNSAGEYIVTIKAKYIFLNSSYVTETLKLQNIKTLSLISNQLTTFDGTGLSSLQIFDLSSNQLTSFDGTGLSSLQYLYLGDNQFTSFDGTGLSSLQVLYLNSNQLTSFNGTGLSSLQVLYLGDNQYTSFDGTGLSSLQYLYLNSNQLTLNSIEVILNVIKNYTINNGYLDLRGGTNADYNSWSAQAKADKITLTSNPRNWQIDNN